LHWVGDETVDAGAGGFERYAKTTRRAAFLAEMEPAIPLASALDADLPLMSPAASPRA
jgi:hypothetical protein